LETDPRRQTFREAVAFQQGFERRYDPAVQQADVARANRHGCGRIAIDDGIEHRRAKAPRKSFVATRTARGAHHVGTVLPGIEHFCNQGDRVLQVGVHRHNHVATGMVNADGQCSLFAKVA